MRYVRAARNSYNTKRNTTVSTRPHILRFMLHIDADTGSFEQIMKNDASLTPTREHILVAADLQTSNNVAKA